MKLLDANILLYAYDKSATHHEACRVWLESVFNADETIAQIGRASCRERVC